MLSKRSRHQLMKTLVRQKRVGTQLELVEALGDLGCDVTQATVSRDIRELGLTKARDAVGRPYYTLPEGEERRDPEGACARMLSEFAHTVVTAQNLVVVRGEVGTAPGLGKVIDGLEHELVLGTVAGDDTVLVVCKDNQAAESVATHLKRLGG